MTRVRAARLPWPEGRGRWPWVLVLHHQQLDQRQRVVLTTSMANTIHVVM